MDQWSRRWQAQLAERNLAGIKDYGWKLHCRGLFETPVPA